MPIAPPSHPQWLDMPQLPIVDGIPSTDILEAADLFCHKACEGFRLDKPHAYIAMREGFAYQYQLNQAKQNGVNLFEENVALILKELAIIRAKVTKFDDKFAQIDDKFAQIDDKFAQIDDKFAKLNEKIDQNHNELLRQLRYQDGFLRKGLNRAALGGVWVPVKNQQGVHPAEKNLPLILGMDDVFALSEERLKSFLAFYEFEVVPKIEDGDYPGGELQYFLLKHLTTPERDEPMSVRKYKR